MKLNQLTTAYYHVTPSKNVASIMKTGLEPRIGDRSKILELKKAIYLFGSITDVEDAVSGWLGDQFGKENKLSLLKIDLSNDTSVKQVAFEYQVFCPIAPDYITVEDNNY